MKRLTPTLLLAAMSFASLEAMAAADLVLLNGQVFTADRAPVSYTHLTLPTIYSV